MQSKKESPTIQDSEEALEAFLLGLRRRQMSDAEQLQVLGFFAPAGFRPVVELQEDGRKKRRSASADNWNPETGEIHVYFERVAESPAEPTSARPAEPASAPDQHLAEILRALEEVETAPGHSFVALKWFRDEVLPAKGYAWAQNADGRQGVLSRAINEGWILTSKVTNPRQPLYPTTAVRLNRQKQLPAATQQTSRFRPVPISGEPLSATILRDRGTR
jgi:hypothetical protein